MNGTRALRLRREVLAELRDGELESVAGAAAAGPSAFETWCQNTYCPFTRCITCWTCLCTDGCTPACGTAP